MADLKNDAKLAAEEEGARVGVEVEAQTDFMTVLLEVPLPCLASPPPSPPVAEPAALRSATTQRGLTHIRPQHSGGHVSLVEAAMSAACSAADEADLGGGKRPGRMPPCARFHAYCTSINSLAIEDARACCACAVHAGKMFLSPGHGRLVVCCHVPEVRI